MPALTARPRALPALLFAALLGAGQSAGPQAAQGAIPPDADVTTLQSAMAAGSLSAVAITEHYLARIATLDPALRSVLEVNPEALAIAAALDAERQAGRVRSPLHGIPVLLKDNIDTADQLHTTAGSLALLDAPVPASDAFLVSRLREAGAVILGKTNMSEWANFRSTSSSSGWSSRGGQTLNPYDLTRTPCGSSSGSAVAVASDFAVLAVGTETDGSIVCPASHNSIVGIKPSLGLVSRVGIIPIAHSQDTAGPMARTVRDAVLLLNVLVAEDVQDEITSNLRTRTPLDYTAFLQEDGLQGKRIGVMRQHFGRNATLDALMETQLQVLRDAGAEVFDIAINPARSFGAAETQVLLFEFKNDLQNYLYERGGELQTLADLIAFNEANAATVMPLFGQELFLQAQETTNLGDAEYLSALGYSKAFSQSSLNSVMQDLELDALVAPTNSIGWPVAPGGDKTEGYVSSASLPAVSGYPNITVPAGYLQNFPIGLSFMGRQYSEPALIAIAYAYEQATLTRQAPALPTP